MLRSHLKSFLGILFHIQHTLPRSVCVSHKIHAKPPVRSGNLIISCQNGKHFALHFAACCFPFFFLFFFRFLLFFLGSLWILYQINKATSKQSTEWHRDEKKRRMDAATNNGCFCGWQKNIFSAGKKLELRHFSGKMFSQFFLFPHPCSPSALPRATRRMRNFSCDSANYHIVYGITFFKIKWFCSGKKLYM